MTNPVTIQVCDFTGWPFAVSVDDGQRLHDATAPVLRQRTPVVLSVAGIEAVIGAFLGAAIGRLYGEMASEDVDALLSIRCLDREPMESVKRVVANSKRYYGNPEAYDAAWKEVVDHEAG